MQGHTGPVTSLAVQQQHDGGLLLASTAGDGAVNLWERAAAAAGACSSSSTDGSSWAEDRWLLSQSIEWGVQLQHSLALTQVPGQPGW